MELVKRNIKGTEYTFANTTWSNSSGWGHETHLFKNHYELNSRKVRYYNRTWESYQYQTCMMSCVSELIEEKELSLKDRFKEEKGITRLTKKYENEFEKYKEDNETLQELKELYKSLEWRN
jgi:hypothetical protein